MKTSIQQITALLDSAPILTIDDGIFAICIIEKPTGDRDNPWLTFRWDDDGLAFEIIVNEGAVDSATVEDGRLVLIANDGDPVKITILRPSPVSERDISA